ncbi:MAG: type II secretion system protein [Candidatus Liptonbacteria bacterium]|nr:type II secretion system protein [Candidatus Liptonbacteria bacterium]
MNKKGFTLIELLVVIAILAILSVAVVLTLNPAQLLAQARDSQRISDVSTLKSAIAFYLTDVSSPSIGTSNTLYAADLAVTTSSFAAIYQVDRSSTTLNATTTGSAAASTTGGGWIPINFAGISSGSPLGSEPKDPVNNNTYYYSYITNGSPSYQFEINANMESTKYAASGTADAESVDGGTSFRIYEAGTNLGL